MSTPTSAPITARSTTRRSAASRSSRSAGGSTRDGAFMGVLEASVLPSNFFRFFSTLAYTQGLQYALIRNDGLFLARYPEAPTGATEQLDETHRLPPHHRRASGGRPLHHDLAGRPHRAALRRAPLRQHAAVSQRRHRELDHPRRMASRHVGASDLRHSGDADPVPDAAGRAAADAAALRGDGPARRRRGIAAAIAEARSDRPSHRRGRARLQQPPHHHHRQSRDRAAASSEILDRRRAGPAGAPRRERHAWRPARRHADQAAAGVFPAAAAQPEPARHQPAAERACRLPEAGARRGRLAGDRRPAAASGRSRPMPRSSRRSSSISPSTPATPCRTAASSPSRPATPTWTRPIAGSTTSRPASTC